MPAPTPPPPDQPTDLRRFRTRSERNYLLGFFALLFIVGGALIFLFYGGGGLAAGVLCMVGGAMLVGVLVFVMFGLEWLSQWLENRD